MKQKNCDYCKKKFLYKDNRVKYCGGQCISLFRKQLYKEGKIKTWNKGLIGFKHSGSFQKGKKHWNYGNKGIAAEFTWKGGIANHSSGYILHYCPNHPLANKDHYVKEQILVMEKYLGRFLTKEEIVHHLDFNKKNNNIENLYLFPNDSEHRKYHWQLIKIVKEELKNVSLRIGCVNLK